MANKYIISPLPLKPTQVLLIRAQDEIEHDEYFNQWNWLLSNVLFKEVTVPGNHQNLLLKPHVENIVPIVINELNN